MHKDSSLERKLKRLLREERTSHQKAISRLVKRLKKDHPDYKIFKNVHYENVNSEEKGECDLLALIGFYNGTRKYALIFEVKTSRKQEHKQKAINQLEKDVREIKAFYGEDVRCFCLSVYTSNNYFRNRRWASKPYNIEWIKGIDG
jgi:hypothetical protein